MNIFPIVCGDNLWNPVTEYAEKCSWRAGQNLAKQMRSNGFVDWERVFVALDNGNIAGYCTLSKDDCIAGLQYKPYISFIFVGELYRGNRLSEKLCHAAMKYAKELGFDKVYLISDHVNLYEKYGFAKIDEKLAPWGAMETIYMKVLDMGGVGNMQVSK